LPATGETDMHEDPRQRRAREVIENGHRLLAEVRTTLEQSQRLLLTMGIDSKAELQRLRDEGGEAAVQRAQVEMQTLLDAVDAQAQRTRMHALPPSGFGRAARMRPNRV
jgi:ElaB/YqjD/DUF883 family membrane-anchored ribosome-binding protein